MNKSKKNKTKKRFFHSDLFKTISCYTICFTIIFVFILLLWLVKYDKMFIFSSDGFLQHTITLRYFRNLLIDFFKNGSFSTFVWQLGNGIDMFGNLAYYILGDFFSYFSIFCPERYIEHFYCLMVIVRIYCIGLCFIAYCKYKKMNCFSSFMGALVYAFCGFVLFASMRHPYFSNAIMILPLLMIGIEKIIVEKKTLFYTIIISVLFISNFYFAYMLSIIIALYGILLTIFTYKKEGIKKIILTLGYVLLYTFIGIAISCVVLLPAAYAFLNSERSGGLTIYPYSLSYYRNVVNFLGNASSYWVIIDVSSLLIIALVSFIIRRKNNYPLFFTLLLLMLPILISQIGSVLCGFSFPNDRWTFAVSFIFAFIIASFLNSNSEMCNKELGLIYVSIAVYILLCNIMETKIGLIGQFQLILCLLFLFVFHMKERLGSRMFNVALCGLLIINIMGMAYYRYDVTESNFLNNYMDYDEYDASVMTLNKQNINFNKQINNIKEYDTSFYKISKYPSGFYNWGLLMNFNSIDVYYSILPSNYTDLSKELLNSQYAISNAHTEFDYRPKILSLLGVKYLVVPPNYNVNLPYGFESMDNIENVYKNNYYLPFGVLYTNSISLESYDKLSPLEKESTMLKSVALESSNEEFNDDNNIKDIPYEIIDSKGIIKSNNINIASTNYNSFKLKLDEEYKDSDIYIQIYNLKFNPPSKSEIISASIPEKSSKFQIEKVKKQYKWYQPNYSFTLNVKYGKINNKNTVNNPATSPYVINTNDYLFNLGKFDNTTDEITISLSSKGSYTYDDIAVYAVPFDTYESEIENLRKSNFEVEDYGNGYMVASANPTEDGVLQFATSYSDFWNVYVDGKKVETFKANKSFLAINITSGKHKIELKYKNKCIEYGSYISLFGIFCLLISVIYRKLKKAKN